MKLVIRVIFVVVCVPALVLLIAGFVKTHESPAEAVSSFEADKLIEDYNFLARNNGPWIDRCFRAGEIVQAYVSAHEDASYAKWRAVKQHDCAKAGW